jgi:hypothetical protein
MREKGKERDRESCKTNEQREEYTTGRQTEKGKRRLMEVLLTKLSISYL